MPVLKDTEASLDIGCEKYAAPEMFTGEHASIKHILNDTMTCLQPAERKIECEPVHVVSKPIVSPGHLDGGKYFLEDQTIEPLEPDSEQNCLSRREIGNGTQTRRERKETEKSIRLENENDQFRLRGSEVEIGEDFVPSLTGEGTDNGNLVKLSACEIIEAQLRSEESAHLIWGTKNGASDEAKGWDFPIDHMDGILELDTHLAVRPAEFELAQDGVEYCSHVVGLEKAVPSSTEG
ncbi:uncharacterized protein TNCV_4172461 [Trichonephila clavipes]|nr:uncharacterized protein TNCV_4172461 [Trichonephila clavipes]